jgi:hypothetical protein
VIDTASITSSPSQQQHFFRPDCSPKATKANVKEALQDADWAHVGERGR